MTKLRLYDSTRLDAAKNCMRYYYLRHERSWRSEGTGAALVFGSSWGSAMDALWARYKDLYTDKESRADVIEEAYQAFLSKWVSEGFKHPDQLTIDDIDDLGARTPITALEMLNNYVDAREHIFTDPSFELLSIEEPFIVPLDPHDPTLFYVGRMDKVFRYRGQVLGLDHKTSSLIRGKVGKYTFANDWIDTWSMNDQCDGYSYAGHQQYGEEFGGIWIDGAMVHKTEHKLFKLIPIDKQMAALNRWLWTAHTWIDQIEANKSALPERSSTDSEYLACFPENRKSCVSTYGRCNFFDLCRMVGNPAKIEGPPPGFKVSPWAPMDELKLQAVLGEDAEDLVSSPA